MNEYLKDFLCGAIAGLFGCLVSHPFDTLKVYFFNTSAEYRLTTIITSLQCKL